MDFKKRFTEELENTVAQIVEKLSKEYHIEQMELYCSDKCEQLFCEECYGRIDKTDAWCKRCGTKLNRDKKKFKK